MSTAIKIETPRQSYPWWINALLTLVFLGLVGAIGLALANPATTGFVPVAAQSNLRANYGVDARGTPIAALNLQIVQEALEDLRPTLNPNTPASGLATATVPSILQQLLTPVATLTPQPGETQPTARPSATPTATITPTASPTPIPPTATPSHTATDLPTSTSTALAPTRTPTLQPSRTLPPLTRTATRTFTASPTLEAGGPTATPLPDLPTNTPQPSQPTATPPPVLPTNTVPPPATNTPQPPPATNTPDPYVPPPSSPPPTGYP